MFICKYSGIYIPVLVHINQICFEQNLPTNVSPMNQNLVQTDHLTEGLSAISQLPDWNKTTLLNHCYSHKRIILTRACKDFWKLCQTAMGSRQVYFNAHHSTMALWNQQDLSGIWATGKTMPSVHISLETSIIFSLFWCKKKIITSYQKSKVLLKCF